MNHNRTSCLPQLISRFTPDENTFPVRHHITTQPRSSDFHLIIGLGGDGQHMALQVKSALAGLYDTPPDNVLYLCIDTDDFDLHRSRSPQENAAAFTEQEQIFLSPRALPMPFRAGPLYEQGLLPHALTDWLDERIELQNPKTGSCAIRQVGRLLLHMNYPELVRRISQTLERLARQMRLHTHHPCLTVHFLTGLSGGTGSALMIDLPRILRALLNRRIPNLSRTDFICYPTLRLSSYKDAFLARNAYAALQELDCSLSLNEPDEHCPIRYPDGTRLPGDDDHRRIYDHVFLLMDGALLRAPDIPDKRPVRTAVSLILGQIFPQTTPHELTLLNLFSSTGYTNHLLPGRRSFPHRYHQYQSAGCAQCSLPVSEMKEYAASLLFDRMKDLTDRFPTQQECANVLPAFLLREDQLFSMLNSVFPVSPPPAQTYDELIRNPSFWRDEIQKACDLIYNHLPDKEDRFTALLQKLTDRFDRCIMNVLEDPEKGPFFAERLISDAILPALNEFRRRIEAEACIYPRYKYDRAIHDLSAPLPIFGRSLEKNRRADLVNRAGYALYQNCLLQSLTGPDCVLISRLHHYIEDRMSMLIRPACSLLTRLSSRFFGAADVLSAASGPWGEEELSFLRSLIESRFNERFDSSPGSCIHSFLRLFDDELGTFLEAEFDCITRLTLDDVLSGLNSAAFEPDALIGRLVDEAVPLCRPGSPDCPDTEHCFIWMPSNSSPDLFNAVHQLCSLRFADRYHLMTSPDQTNITVLRIIPCLSLAELPLTRHLEEAYAELRHEPGVHLIHTAHSPHAAEARSWNDLYSLIPAWRRTLPAPTAAIERLIAEETERKQLFEPLLEPGAAFSELEQTETEWILRLTLTKPSFEIQENDLIWATEENGIRTELKRWSFPPEDPDAVKKELQSLIETGLSALPGSSPVRRTAAGRVCCHPETGQPDAFLTRDSVLEHCQCRFGLVCSVRKEKAKYDMLADYLKRLSAAGV